MPSPPTLTLPFSAVAAVTVSAPPSGSVSLAITSIVIVPPAVTVAASPPATGGLSPSVMVTVTVPTVVPPAASATV